MKKFFTGRRVMDVILALACILSVLGLVLRPQEASDAARSGLTLCFEVIIPSLFPFFVMSSLIVELGFAGYLGRLLERLMRPLFNVSGACSTAVVLGFIGGYPVGAKTAISIYEKGLCSKQEAERLLSFCNNSGPAFILGVVGAGIFANSRAGIMLYLAHTLASLMVGFIFRFYKRKAPPSHLGGSTFETVRLSKAFTKSVSGSFQSLLGICAFVLFFTVAINMLAEFGILPWLAELLNTAFGPFGMSVEVAQEIITGVIEMTSGLWSLHGSAAALAGQFAMAAFMLGWAGLSVHCQVISFIGESGLSIWTYLGGKMIHAVLSTLLAIAAFTLFPFESSVVDTMAQQLSAIAKLDFGMAFTGSIAACLLLTISVCLCMGIYAIRRNRNKTR